MSWLRADLSAPRLVLHIHVQPGAKRSEIAGVHGDALKIRIASPPVEGKANARLIEFLADTLGIAKAQIQLLSGETRRTKRLALTGLTERVVREKLGLA